MFYFLTLFTLNTYSNRMNYDFCLQQCYKDLKQNVRGSCGVGLAMPIGPGFYIEVLLNMMHWRKKMLDRTNILQLRISIDD